MVQKIIRKIISGISVVLIIFSVFILLTVLFTKNGNAPSYFGYSVFRVLTGSMEPTLPVDTMTLVKRCGPEEINEGDIITFYTLEPEIYGMVVTHRAVRKFTVDGKICFITRGDANYSEDANPVEPQYLLGKVVASSLILGKFVRLLNHPIIFLVFILIPLIIVLVLNIVTTVRTAKEIQNEETEKALLEAVEQKRRKVEEIEKQLAVIQKDNEINK